MRHPTDATADLVSVITPAYKAASVISATLDAAIAQTHPNWEMLVADDCSPDETRDVVGRYAALDRRIRLIPLEKNGGPAAARNEGLAQARGRWIAFLDSDDLWLPTKLERSLAHAKARRAALVFTGYRRINHDGTATGGYIPVPATLSYSQLLGNTAIATSTVLLDRELCGDVRMQSVYYDDFACWLGILKRGFLAYGLDEDLMRYRVMARSVSRNKARSASEVWKTYRQVEHLALAPSAWHFSRYAYHALRKYSRF